MQMEALEDRTLLSTDTWTGLGGNNLYSNAMNWSSGVPNSGQSVVIPTSFAVTMDISATIGTLTIDATSSLSIEAGKSLSFTGDVTNQGTINVGDATGAAALEPDPAVSGTTITLSGGGIINLQNPGSQIYGYNNSTLDNVDNTIQGQGTIVSLVSFENDAAGTVDASGGTLTISVPTTNYGTLEATASTSSMGQTVGGTLDINGTSVTNGTNPGTNPGTISTDALSTVNIISSTITGGNLTSVGNSVIHGTGTVYLDGVTLTTGSTYSVDPGGATQLTGDLTNQGTINVGNATGGAAALEPDPAVSGGTITLSGGGIINLQNPGSQIYGYNNSTLDNVDNTIQGQGTIVSLVSFENDAAGTVDASGGTLTISVPTTNYGTLEATASTSSMGQTVGGTLDINGTSVTNGTNPGTNPGTISTDALSTVNIISSTITGGNLTSVGNSVIHGTGTVYLDGVTLTTGSTYSVDPGGATQLTGDLTNQGTINVGNATGGAAALEPDPAVSGGTITLSGGGIINLQNPGSQIYGYNNSTLVNEDNLIQGQGNSQGSIVGLASFVNDATVDSNVSGGTLTISVPTTNYGTLEATAGTGETVGGTLEINGTSVTNETNPGTNPGTISTDALSTVNIISSAITDGNLTSAGGSVIHGTGTVYLDGVTLTTGSTYSVDPGGATQLTGDLTNQGTINVGNATGGAAALEPDPAVSGGTITLSGGGIINLQNPGSQIYGYNNSTLDNMDNTIQGQGNIAGLASFQNDAKATVDADVSGGTLSITQAPTTNTGTFEAQAGATLNLVNTTLTNFAAGTLTGGTYEVYSGTLSFNNGGYSNDIVTNAANILLGGTSGRRASWIRTAITPWPSSRPMRPPATSPFRTA